MAKHGNWIDTKEVAGQFESTLKKEGNKRLIFSGIFGIGKTTFLKEYFQKDEDSIPLFLYPVNYSIATNEDIFELIKYDILYQILLQNPKLTLDDKDVLKLDVIPYLDWSDTYSILKPFIEAIPSLDKNVTKILDATENLLKVLESKKGIFNNGNEAKVISDFGKKIEKRAGGIYERDLYTDLIKTLIERLRYNAEHKKKVVLIIDDLDRIDPEHIFRILNIFAAHFDSEDYRMSDNKFGIDQVILSCDINNIRNIFHHKYGGQVDFNGYIDKFSSKEVFYFDIRSIVSKQIQSVLASIKNDKISNSQLTVNYQVEHFLMNMAVSSSFNLRSLFKYESKEYHFTNYSFQFPYGRITNYSLNLFVTFDFITSVLGGLENTRQAFTASNFVFAKENLAYWDAVLPELIFLADHLNNKLRAGNYKQTIDGIQIEYNVNGGTLPWKIKLASFNGFKRTEDLEKRIEEGMYIMNIKELILSAFREFEKYRRTAV